MQPLLASKTSFDATKSTKFYFTSQDKQLVAKCKLTICDNNTGTQVYTGTQTITYGNFYFTLPANALTNSTSSTTKYYYAYINTIDADDNLSINSNTVQFRTFATPTLQFVNLQSGDVLTSSAFTFNVNYNQSAGDYLSAYRFGIQDTRSGNIIADSGVVYDTSKLSSITISYTSSALSDNGSYAIFCVAVSASGVEAETGLVNFNTSFSPISGVTTITLTNDCTNGQIVIACVTDQTTATTATNVRVKRKLQGEDNWITIYQKQVFSAADLTFTIRDNLAGCETYQYAFVPVRGAIEGQYTTMSIVSKFNDLFICDDDTIYKFKGNIQYNTTTSNQQVGVFTPFGRKYPIIVSNGIVGYDQGSFSGIVLTDNYYSNFVIDGQNIRVLRNNIIKFLTNKKSKILKDRNGNTYLVGITGNPNTDYDNSYGQAVVTISADWTEVGDANNNSDLFNNGLIPVEE